MKKILIILNSAFCIFNSSFAQSGIQWQKCLGGIYDDRANAIQQTTDGGYIVAGSSVSDDGDVTGNHGGSDVWVVKLSGNGIVQWQKCFGGAQEEKAYSIQQTVDGGYVVAGYATSNDGDVSGHHGSVSSRDFWIVKLNATGVLQWQKSFGGSDDDHANSIQQTNEGGYIVTGYTLSYDGDVTGNHGETDYWIVKMNNSGNLQWQKSFGGIYMEESSCIQKTTDGGYIVAGAAQSSSGNVTCFPVIGAGWIIKLDSAGSIQWQQCLGGTDIDFARTIQQTVDGGYIVAAGTYSPELTGYHGILDYWIIKLDSSGALQWERCLGGTNNDDAYSVEQTTDGGYIIAGFTISNNGDVSSNHGYNDCWIVKLDTSGFIQWKKCFGGMGWDEAYSIQQTSDGGYVVAGLTDSNDGDVSGNHGSLDYWIVKLSPDVGIEEENNNSLFNISPNPFTTQTTINFNNAVHNATFSLYNLLGEKVAETTGISGESFLFIRGSLPSGVYVFDVTEKAKRIARGKAMVY